MHHLLGNTVCFVLGAGASQPYGFPLGSELKKSMLETLERDDTLEILRIAHDFDDVLADDFANAVRFGSHDTIDILLEEHPRFRTIGAYLIIMTLLPYEQQVNLFPQQDWYKFLYPLLITEYYTQTIFLANLTIVTLNYDRSLEHFFNCSIEYDCPESQRDEARKNLSQIQIIHAHGSLGDYPDTEYGMSVTDHAMVTEAAEKIKIVGDKIENSPLFRSAQEAIGSASRVFFFGFGYDERTLDALLVKSGDNRQQVVGTSISLSPTKRNMLKEKFGEDFFSVEDGMGSLVNCEQLSAYLADKSNFQS